MSGKCIQKDATTKVARQYLGVLKLSDVPGNLSKTCRRGGIDRTGFYGWKRRVQTHGLERLKDLPPIPKSRPSTTTPETEAKLLSAGMAHPSRRCVKLSYFLKLQMGSVSSSASQKRPVRNRPASVYDLWLRPEENSFDDESELTAESIAKNEKYKPCFKERPGESSRSGELLSKHFLAGNLK